MFVLLYEIIVLESCKTKGRKGKRKFKRCAAERKTSGKRGREDRREGQRERERNTEGEPRINEGTQTRGEEDKHKNGIAHERKREQRGEGKEQQRTQKPN
jgi:hypothetical protein